MCLNIAVPSSKLSIIESSRMSLYQIDGALPPADEYANVLGMLVGRPDVKFQFGKNHWTFLVMQSEKKASKNKIRVGICRTRLTFEQTRSVFWNNCFHHGNRFGYNKTVWICRINIFRTFIASDS